MNRKAKPNQQSKINLNLPISLQNIVDGVEDELLVIDSDYRIRFANSAARGRYSQAEDSLIGHLCFKALHGRNNPCSVPLWNCPLKEVMRSSRASTNIHPVRAPGADTYLKITTYPLQDNHGQTKAVIELRRDVTAERELETQILRRHHQLLALSRISSAVSGLRDLDTTLRIALDNVLEIIDSAVGGILLLDVKTRTLYYRVQHGLSAGYTENRRIALGEGIAGRVAQTGESILLEDVSKDPRSARPDLVSAEGIKGFVSIPLKTKHKVVGVMNIFSHVAGHFGADDVYLLNSIGDYLGTTIEQAKLYEHLARVGERYRVLLQHALTAQEQERKRIARELHDETAQSLTSLTLSLQAIIGMAEMKGFNDADFIEKLQKTHSYAVHAGNEIVRLMKELRPTLLDELGLPAAIHRYAKDNLQAQGINVSAEFTGTEQRFPPEVEVTLFRIAQGGIGNILEHSGAANVSIKLECNTSECVLTIKDDGKGFDVSKLTRVDPRGRGAGLFTMRERTSLLGGSGYVESKPGQGTKITARVPLVANVEDLVKDAIDEENKSTDS
ncbi:GAF domain-containing protein [Chloroflexota bacterium]